MPLLFPFAEYWWFYAAFIGFVLVLLALDLGVFHRHGARGVVPGVAGLVGRLGRDSRSSSTTASTCTPPASSGRSVGQRIGLEFLTGYVVEKSLAVDNIFVFVLVFRYFAIPPMYQHRVLFYGIIGALVFRAIFIASARC